MTEQNKQQQPPTQSVLPAVITLNTDVGPYSQAQNEKDQKLTRQVNGVMFLDTLTQKEIIKAETPKYEKAVKKAEELQAKLTSKAKSIALEQKDCEKAKAIKAAMKAIDITVNVRTEFVRLDLEVQDHSMIWFKWVVSEAGGDNYRGTMDSDEQAVEVDDAMNKALVEYWAARKAAKAAKDAIIDAQTKLSERANRMADAQGALALKSMSQAEREEIKAVYENLKEGVDVGRLLKT